MCISKLTVGSSQVLDELFSRPEFTDFPASLHLAMLQDPVRMSAYREAISNTVKPGDTVVDVGSGTGILSFLAFQAGAQSVHGFEISSLCDHAAKVRDSNFPDADIQFHQIDLLNDELPDISADVIICELFGNFGIEEDLLRILARVRKELLRPGGKLLPETLELHIAPVQCTSAYREIANWQTVIEGIDFSSCQDLAYNAVYQIHNEPVHCLAGAKKIAALDLYTVSSLPAIAQVSFSLSEGTLHGVAGWFRTQLCENCMLDTGPAQQDTHWGQVFFPTGDPVNVDHQHDLSFRFKEENDGHTALWQWQGELKKADKLISYCYCTIRKLTG